MMLADEIRLKVVLGKSQKTGSALMRKNREMYCLKISIDEDRELQR